MDATSNAGWLTFSCAASAVARKLSVQTTWIFILEIVAQRRASRNRVLSQLEKETPANRKRFIGRLFGLAAYKSAASHRQSSFRAIAGEPAPDNESNL